MALFGFCPTTPFLFEQTAMPMGDQEAAPGPGHVPSKSPLSLPPGVMLGVPCIKINYRTHTHHPLQQNLKPKWIVHVSFVCPAVYKKKRRVPLFLGGWGLLLLTLILKLLGLLQWIAFIFPPTLTYCSLKLFLKRGSVQLHYFLLS